MKLTFHEKLNVDDIMNLIHDLDQDLLDTKAVDLESVNDFNERLNDMLKKPAASLGCFKMKKQKKIK